MDKNKIKPEILYKAEKGNAKKDKSCCNVKMRQETIRITTKQIREMTTHLIFEAKSSTLGKGRPFIFVLNAACHGKYWKIHGNYKPTNNNT